MKLAQKKGQYEHYFEYLNHIFWIDGMAENTTYKVKHFPA